MLRRKFLVHITLLLFFLLLVEVNSFKPENREFHTATLIGNELYILGGRDLIAKSPSKDFFYLDVSKKFTTDKLPWIDLSEYNTNTTNTTTFVPPHFGAASAMGGVHNDTLFLYGGVLPNNTTKFVYMFDPNAKMWTTPVIDMKKIEIDNVNDTRKSQMTGIIDCNGKMYLWGGEVDGQSSKEMIILDTKNFTLNHDQFNKAISRINYGAVLLPDQSIIYMGGFINHDEDVSSLDSIWIFNTINNKWSTKHTSGKIPSDRSGFSAILGPNNQIIIFGGSEKTDSQIISPGDALYTLNLTNHRWKHITANNAPSTRTGHKANLVGNYMIVSFGSGYNQTQEKDIILLEISGNKYKWTNKFDPSPTSSLSSSPSSHLTQSIQSTTSVNSSTTNSQPSVLADKLFNKPTLIGAIMGTMIGSSLLSFGGFMLYKRNKLLKRHQIDTLRISGSEDGNQIDRNTFIQRIRNSTHS